MSRVIVVYMSVSLREWALSRSRVCSVLQLLAIFSFSTSADSHYRSLFILTHLSIPVSIRCLPVPACMFVSSSGLSCLQWIPVVSPHPSTDHRAPALCTEHLTIEVPVCPSLSVFPCVDRPELLFTREIATTP